MLLVLNTREDECQSESDEEKETRCGLLLFLFKHDIGRASEQARAIQ
jgi:hypothetical protein